MGIVKHIKLRRNTEVGLPIGRVFNEAFRVDVGVLGEKFLVMVDLATHSGQGSWIRNKTPEEIIKSYRKMDRCVWDTKEDTE